MVEQLTLNQRVGGSNPPWLTIRNKGLQAFLQPFFIPFTARHRISYSTFPTLFSLSAVGMHGTIELSRIHQKNSRTAARLIVGKVVKKEKKYWRSLKYESIFLHAYETGSEVRAGLQKWVDRYNKERPHSTLDDRTPHEAYFNLPSPGYAAATLAA